MISFKIGFLLAFSLEFADTQNDKGKKKMESKKSKKDKRNRPKNKSINSLDGIEKDEIKPLPPYVLDLEKPVGYAHIEYELLPNRPKESVDIICWKGVVKVSSMYF